MHCSNILIVLLAAAATTVSARPVHHPHSHDLDSRELQYSDISRLDGSPDFWRHGTKSKHSGHGGHHHEDEDELNYYDEEEYHHRHYDERRPHHERHPHDGKHPHHERHPHDRHHGSARHDMVDNIIRFLSHEARSVPDVSAEVVKGIVDFLSHETRSNHADGSGLPKNKVIKNILDFFASSARR